MVEEASVTEVHIIGLDLAKRVFQAHGASSDGAVLFRKKLSRNQVLAFFSSQPQCIVAYANIHCERQALTDGSLRERSSLGTRDRCAGHEVRLISPAYVKPFVKRQKNDMADAEAICEAGSRVNMRFVPVKSAEKQASAVAFKTRDLLVRQRSHP
jgi:transposase